MAANAYAALDPVLTSPPRAEAMVFAKITKQMERVFADDESPITARVSTLHDNRRLWQRTAIMCASDDNAMPDGLRASLIGLAGFVERHTSAVMNGSAEPQVLFEINRRVAAGLSAGSR